MKNLLEENNLLKPPKVGEIIKGKVVETGRSSVFIDLGVWGTGIIYGKEFYEAKDALRNLKIGNEIFAKITELENEDGYVELSLSQAGKELTWETLKEKKEKKEKITVKISGANKGGLLAEVSRINAFLPLSQLSSEHYPKVKEGDKLKILMELQKFIGKEIEVQIFDLDPREEKLILSEKIKETEKIKKMLENYKVGDIVKGRITGLVNFGAFINFPDSETNKNNGLEGLIHISELDWQLINNPAEVVKVGEKVKAKIIGISDDKVSLSLKSLKKDPWKGIEKKYKKGDTVSGKVTKFNPFGAFVRITPKIQGLCHISEFGTKAKMEDVLKIDKKYNFQILEIQPKEHRMNLKLA